MVLFSIKPKIHIKWPQPNFNVFKLSASPCVGFILGNNLTISKSVQLLLLLFLVFAGLFYARNFLIPIAFAGIISMLLMPLSSRLEAMGLSRGLSVSLCLLAFIISISAIFALLVWQVSDLAKDLSQVEQKANVAIDQLKAFINAKLGIAEAQQDKLIQEQQRSGQDVSRNIFGSVIDIIVDLILVLVYSFMFIFFRSHLKTFFMKLTPAGQNEKVNKIIADSTKVAHKYLSGLFMMIVLLWILYGIGFSIAGVPNAIFFAVLCGILEIVPFVGNLTGTGITLLMALSAGGGTMAIAVLITYALVQFFQTYIIEPVVVGGEVNINPLFTILALVLGEELWGIAGMILAIPLLGIAKIIFDNVEALHPYGFLIGAEKKDEQRSFAFRFKRWFNKSKKEKRF